MPHCSKSSYPELNGVALFKEVSVLQELWVVIHFFSQLELIGKKLYLRL